MQQRRDPQGAGEATRPRAQRPGRGAPAPLADHLSGAQRAVLTLQGRAGNRATAGAVGRSPDQTPHPVPVQRALKFEFQTINPVWRIRPGTSAEKLDRKFGPVRENYLHKGRVGKPRTKRKEGTAVELQSERGGFVEFETASWSRKWTQLAAWITEAIDMTNDISAAGVLLDPSGAPVTGPSGKPLHHFPFTTAHLRRRKGFPSGLRKGEKLFVELVDSTWRAAIQASESIELSEYESLLREHARKPTVTATVSTADRVLKATRTAGKLSNTEMADLRGFVQVVVMYLYRGASQTKLSSNAKSRFRLMARTSFSAMYRSLLTPASQREFDRLVSSGSILAEVNRISGLPAPVTSTSTVYGKGFEHNGRILFGPTVGAWLESIVKQGKLRATKRERRMGKGEPRAHKDLMSHPTGGSAAMGAFGVQTEPKKKTTEQARFEVRGSETHARARPASEWMDYLNGIFLMAWLRRRHGPKGTRLKWR